MDHQIHAGARVALGLVHSHWLGVDLAEVVRGPPGGKDHSMDVHYAAVDELAGRVVRLTAIWVPLLGRSRSLRNRCLVLTVYVCSCLSAFRVVLTGPRVLALS